MVGGKVADLERHSISKGFYTDRRYGHGRGQQWEYLNILLSPEQTDPTAVCPGLQTGMCRQPIVAMEPARQLICALCERHLTLLRYHYDITLAGGG